MYLAGLLPVQNAVGGPKFEETTARSSGMPYTAEDQASQKMKATPNIFNQQNLDKLITQQSQIALSICTVS